jgi:biotin transport system substrate-specific component
MNATIATSLWPAARSNWLVQLFLVALGVAILTISSKLSVPLWPVPVTMQTLAIFLIGAVYGPALALSTVLVWLAGSAAGLPVLEGMKSGPAVFFGGTGGYLVGFPIAAWLAGWVTSRDKGRSWLTALVAFVLAEVVIMVLGFSWLSAIKDMNIAWLYGVKPFIIGDALKIAIATFLTPMAWRAVQGRLDN